LERKYGHHINAEVAQKLVQQGYGTVDHTALKVVSSPSIEGNLDMINAAKDFSFTLGVDVRPTVEVSNYTGLEVVYPTVEITDEEIQKAIDARLFSQRKVEAVDDASATLEKGDYALVALKLMSGEEVVHDVPGTMITLGSNKMYPGLDEHMMGMSVGESKEVEVTIADNAGVEELRGNTFAATIELKQIQRKTTPELTDELAVTLGYVDAADMRSKLQEDMHSSRDLNFKNQARIQLLQQLVASHTFSVPPSMVQDQLGALENELKMQRAYAGEDPRKIVFSDAQRQDLAQRATFAAKAACILGSICEKEGLEVVDADLDAKIQELADMQGQTVENIKAYIAMEGADSVLRERVQEEKTLNWLLDQAVRLEEAKAVETDEAVEGSDSAE
jgi:trigger factor